MPFGEPHDDDSDDDDPNSGARGKQKASSASSGDAQAAAGRSADAQAASAQQQEAMDAQIAQDLQIPADAAGIITVVPASVSAGVDVGVYGGFGLIVQHYDQPGDPLDNDDPDAVLHSSQAECSTNNAEAAIIDDPAAELHRAEQASRSAEQMQVEDARANNDKAAEKEARESRNKKIAAAIGGLLGLGIVTAVLTRVFGVYGGDDVTGVGIKKAPTKGDTGAPVVKDYTLSAQNPNKPVTVDVAPNITTLVNGAVDAAIDTASILLAASDDKAPNRLTVFQAGFFTLDPAKGKLTFTPLPYYTGGLVAANVTIANTAKQRSGNALITLGFDRPPLVLDQFIQADLTQLNRVSFNPLTGKGVDMGGPAVKGTYDIDPTKVFFRVPMPLEGGMPQQGQITIKDGRTAMATGEGTWTIDPTDGTILFAREAAFKGSPTPLTYTVSDKNGLVSNVGKLVVTSYLAQVTAAITKLNSMTDDVFWTNYQNTVVNGNWGTLNDPLKIVTKLTLFRTTHLVMSEVTRGSLQDKDVLAVQKALPDEPALAASYKAWVMKSFDLAELYTQATLLSPVPNPVSGITNGTRYLRLLIITKLIGMWKDALDAMTPTNTN